MSDEVAFSVVGGKVEQLTEVSLEDIGFRERKHLQRWIEDYPEIVSPDLLVITTEFDRWALGSERIRDRLDVTAKADRSRKPTGKSACINVVAMLMSALLVAIVSN